MELCQSYTTKTVEPPALSGAPPIDLSQQSVKLARRVQALPTGRVYHLAVFKGRDCWTISVQDVGKMELIR